MKKRHICILLASIAGGILYWIMSRNPTRENNSGAQANGENGKSDVKSLPTKVKETRDPSLLEKIRDFYEHADVPMNFYGRVIDQDGKGVEGATISFQSERAGVLMADGRVANNNEKGTTTSSADGSFSIKGAEGLTLRINLIEKEGYREGGLTARSFGYRGTPEIHNADAAKPVDFLIVSNSSPKTKIVYNKEIPFSWNRGAVDFLIPGVGKFVITPTRSKSPDQIRNFDWHVDVVMDNAELAKIEQGGAKIAPQDGYQKSFQYGSNQGGPKWAGAIQDHYAFKTTSGLYGIVNFYLVAERPDGEQQGSLEVRINESGARNLD